MPIVTLSYDASTLPDGSGSGGSNGNRRRNTVHVYPTLQFLYRLPCHEPSSVSLCVCPRPDSARD